MDHKNQHLLLILPVPLSREAPDFPYNRQYPVYMPPLVQGLLIYKGISENDLKFSEITL